MQDNNHSHSSGERVKAVSPEDILAARGIRPTAVRLLILNEMMSFSDTFSLNDLEERLETVDKSSIFRTLEVFTSGHIIHEIDDGSGSRKYCVCHNDHNCEAEELHCHFYCEKCQKTYCLDNILIPPVKCPEGFEIHQVEYIMKGICPTCSRNGRDIG